MIFCRFFWFLRFSWIFVFWHNFKIVITVFVHQSSDADCFTVGKPWLSANLRWEHQRLRTHKQKRYGDFENLPNIMKIIQTTTSFTSKHYENPTTSIKIMKIQQSPSKFMKRLLVHCFGYWKNFRCFVFLCCFVFFFVVFPSCSVLLVFLGFVRFWVS